MTPIEKAQELVNKMFNCDKSTPEESMAMLLIHAKQCALIAVDEIINVIEDNCLEYEDNYWEEVKTEIKKL